VIVEAKRFVDAIWAGDIPAVEEMIANGADVNAPDAVGNQPPLRLAIEQQWTEIVHLLIASGADVNRDRGQGWTPLVHAIDIESDGAWQRFHEPDRESTELTELLLAAGATPTEEAFRVAQEYGNRRASALLKRYASRG
jgi:ankyrin repeat protein